jgi:hypothetical protein
MPSNSDQIDASQQTVALYQHQTHAPQQTARHGPRLRSVATIEPASVAFSVRRFGSGSVERPFYKFDGIDCRSELDAKTLNRLIHRHRQFPPTSQ